VWLSVQAGSGAIGRGLRQSPNRDDAGQHQDRYGECERPTGAGFQWHPVIAQWAKTGDCKIRTASLQRPPSEVRETKRLLTDAKGGVPHLVDYQIVCRIGLDHGTRFPARAGMMRGCKS
jgi:hypothetical protein